MAGDWREFIFADLIQSKRLEIGDGYRAKNSELGGDGPIFLRAGNVRDTHIDFSGIERFRRELAGAVASKMSRPGDVIVTTKGNSTGRMSYVGEGLPPFVYSPHLSYWRSLDMKTIVPGFLRYWSRSRQFRDQLAGLAASTDMAPYLSLVDQKRLRILLPPAHEQRAIAHILGTLDDKIELNRRMNETLEAIARALFKSWFVDFDPVRAKAEGRDPGLPKPLADLFPDSFENSELGEIPKGWRVGTVGEVATLSREAVNPGEFPDETFDHFSIPAFDEGRRPKIELGAAIKSIKTLAAGDAVLLSKLNPRIPRIWLPVVRSSHRAICSTEFLVTLPETGISREFLYSFLSTDAFATVFETLVTGTSGSHQRVKPEGLLNMDAIVPDGPLIQEFTSVVRPLLTRASRLHEEAGTLSTLRDTLLPKLISGEMRVRHAKHIVQRAEIVQNA